MNGSDDDRVVRLVRDGVVRPARTAVAKAVLASKPPRPKAGASALKALLDERRRSMKFWDSSAIVPLLLAAAARKEGFVVVTGTPRP